MPNSTPSSGKHPAPKDMPLRARKVARKLLKLKLDRLSPPSNPPIKPTPGSGAGALTVYTIMPDYGMGPYAWIRRSGDGFPADAGVGGNCADVTGWDGDHPISAALHEAFAAWVTEFERASTNPGHPGQVLLDWADFHACGLALARRLKAEVGEAAGVIYEKPAEDPDHAKEERREVLADGSLALLPGMQSSSGAEGRN